MALFQRLDNNYKTSTQRNRSAPGCLLRVVLVCLVVCVQLNLLVPPQALGLVVVRRPPTKNPWTLRFLALQATTTTPPTSTPTLRKNNQKEPWTSRTVSTTNAVTGATATVRPTSSNNNNNNKNAPTAEDEPVDTRPSSSSKPTSAASSSMVPKPASMTPPGNWEELHGNYVLRPSLQDGAPRAVIHFLGGALVGAAPHITYRYLLEGLAEAGFLIVATPFTLSFDRLQTCDAILDRFEQVALPLARTYGALPVIGVGHSAGALLHVLITSLFPDTPRAANALISYNSLQVTDAVPLFEELVQPFFTYVAARNATTTRRNGAEVISTWIELAQAQVCGQVPPDALLQKAVRLLLIPPFLDTPSTQSWIQQTVQVSSSVREAVSAATQNPLLVALSQAGLPPSVLYDLLQALQQIPSLVEEVADGATEFCPPPAQVQSAARRAYRARNTLIVQYQDDGLDESDELHDLLATAGQVVRMKRPMIDIQVQRRTIANAGHAAPLLAPPSWQVATRAEDVLGPAVARNQLQYSKAQETIDELLTWLEASNL